MKTAMSSILVAVLATLAIPVSASTPGHDRGIGQRQASQQQRIQQGWRQGDLTRGEARGLQQQSRDIRQEVHAARSDGRFTPAERHQMQRDLDRQSRDIHRERHDGDRRFGHEERRFGRDEHRFGHDERHAGFDRRPYYGGREPGNGNRYGWNAPGRAFDPRVDRVQRQEHDRIVQGIRSGELTRSEAERLMTEQRRIQAEERRYRVDGVLTRAERSDLYEDLNAASRHIYNETHDADTRR